MLNKDKDMSTNMANRSEALARGKVTKIHA